MIFVSGQKEVKWKPALASERSWGLWSDASILGIHVIRDLRSIWHKGLRTAVDHAHDIWPVLLRERRA